MSKIYIVDRDSEFKGNCFDVIDSETLSFDEYKKLHPGMNLIGYDYEAFKGYVDAYLDEICKEWKEITKEQYNYSLECLPPARWEWDSFFVGECYTHNLYPFCTKHDGKYYASNQRINEEMSVIINSLIEWKNKN